MTSLLIHQFLLLGEWSSHGIEISKNFKLRRGCGIMDSKTQSLTPVPLDIVFNWPGAQPPKWQVWN
uniref:Uncharacterized protein n=1 Tax=Mus spicilegus TaxID=10103 RepID=A0A8C6HV95_MUSSI